MPRGRQAGRQTGRQAGRQPSLLSWRTESPNQGSCQNRRPCKPSAWLCLLNFLTLLPKRSATAGHLPLCGHADEASGRWEQAQLAFLRLVERLALEDCPPPRQLCAPVSDFLSLDSVSESADRGQSRWSRFPSSSEFSCPSGRWGGRL